MSKSLSSTRPRGLECPTCQHRTLDLARPRCPSCKGALVEREFASTGRVWASTVVRIAIPGFTPPYGLAYIDLDDGPRLLARHSVGDRPLAVGDAVAISEIAGDGTVHIELDPEDR